MLIYTVHELFAWETKRPGFVYSCLRAYIISIGEALWLLGLLVAVCCLFREYYLDILFLPESSSSQPKP